MPYFVIHGYASCPKFSHAIFVAQYLSTHLPNFEYKKVEVAPTDWGEHVMEINRDTKWYITKCPLIWKEIHQWGGKRYLIGGLGEFWEYIYCYYGLESRIPKSEINKLATDNLKFFEDRLHEAAERIKNVRIISIIGATQLITTLLLKDLFELPNLAKSEGIIVRLYDESSRSERKYKIMEDTANCYNSMGIFGKEQSVFIVNTTKEALEECDLLIIVEEFTTCSKIQDKDLMLKKCFARMNCLSEDINSVRHRNLRIVVASEGPSCFLGTCLVEFCTTVKPSDIVVIAADEGLSCISVISEKTGLNVSQICAPPVWGFVGMHSFVDVSQTVFKADVYRPHIRSLTAPRGSTLPLGTIKSELRLTSYLIADQDEIARAVEEKKKKMNKALERSATLGKIRSIISLLKLWYGEQPSSDIISLGVCSDGSFGLPPGIIFSQPVILDSKKKKWVPFTDFPLMNDFTRNQISSCVEAASKVLKSFGLLPHVCKDDEEICSNPDCEMNMFI